GGVTLLAKLGGEVKAGSTLDLALLMVGARRTTWNHVTKADLKGSCDGATHFVFGAFVGAFAMQQGSEGSVATTATLFGAGAGASSASSKAVSTKSGEPDACNKADPMTKEPPSRCSVPIRLELLPIDVAPPAASDDTPQASASLGSDACP